MSHSETNFIGAYEAKSRFSQLLERVAAGEEITITRHGSPVARLVPVQVVPSMAARENAVQKMQELAARNRLDGLKVRDLMAEGRK